LPNEQAIELVNEIEDGIMDLVNVIINLF